MARGRSGPGDSVNASGGRETQRRAGGQAKARVLRADGRAGGKTRTPGRRGEAGAGASGGAGRSGLARAARLKPTQGRRGTAPAQSASPRLFLLGAPFPAASGRPRPTPRRAWRAEAAAGPAERGAERARPGPRRAGVQFDFSPRFGRGGHPRAGAFPAPWPP